MEKNLSLYDCVKLMCGKIKPIGDSSIDADRYKNLCTTIELTSALIDDINDVSLYQFNKPYSERQAGKTAEEFMDALRKRFEL